MRIPFEKLVEKVYAMTEEEWKATLGEISEKWGGEKRGVTPDRLMDAMDCIRMMRGERTYI